MSSPTSEPATAEENNGEPTKPSKPKRDPLNLSMVEVHGCRVGVWSNMEKTLQNLESIRNMKLRDDDVMVLAYPKCGTHWIWEVVQMVLRQRTTLDPQVKETAMLEFSDVSTSLDNEESPRVLNSHNVIPLLPQEMVEKKTKIIHVVRNPKDTVVSMFHHYVQMNETVTFEKLLEQCMADELPRHHQFHYLRQMQTFQEQHPDHPVHLVYYENMKLNPTQVIKELADFLGVSVSVEYCQAVADACNFNKMKNFDPQKIRNKMVEKEFGDKSVEFYRKGIIGDWKNAFTVAQNEAFDEFIVRESEGLKFQFIYE